MRHYRCRIAQNITDLIMIVGSGFTFAGSKKYTAKSIAILFINKLIANNRAAGELPVIIDFLSRTQSSRFNAILWSPYVIG